MEADLLLQQHLLQREHMEVALRPAKSTLMFKDSISLLPLYKHFGKLKSLSVLFIFHIILIQYEQKTMDSAAVKTVK